METKFDDKETQELIKRIDEDLKRALSEKRYTHSVGVMKKAVELAKIYGEDQNKAKLIGLAHDIAKELSKEEKLKYAKENGIEIDEIEAINVGLLHGKIGADICKKKYGFTEDMQKAIEYHTIGNRDMDTLAKILFVADKTEENRKYKNVEKQDELEKARELAKNNLDKAVVYEIDMSLEYTLGKNELIHPEGIYTRNKIIIKMQ